MSNNHLAYGPECHAVETVMRLHSVKRWHMIDTTRQQTLAEHSANVALLAMTIAKLTPIFHFGDPSLIAAAALVHDIPEAFTGDIPTHTKRHLSGIEELEMEVTHPIFHILVSRSDRALIKICDLADGIRFIRLHGVDATARHAQKGLEDQFSNMLALVSVDMDWPTDVTAFVRKIATFYAYENG